MTESIRRSGEYENPYQAPYEGARQHASSPAVPSPATSSPVNPEWPPPPAHRPAAPHDPQQTARQPVPQQTARQPAVDPATGWQAQAAPSGGGHGGGTALLAPPAAEPAPHARKKRTRGPLALLAAVAIVAAAIGGGTAYGIQELTGKDEAVATSTTTSVVPSSKTGDVATIAAAVSPSVVEVSATLSNGTSTGSGVIITSGGEVVTNNHVVSGANSIKVTTSDGKSYTAKVVGTDSKKDLALIKLENASGLKAATLGDSDGVKVGDTVVAIGSPEGLTGTVTSGIVSALDRDVTVSTDENQGQQQGGGEGNWPFQFGGRQFNGDTGQSTTTYKALQTDASLNPGNSGGALINAAGDIIGINSAMYSAAADSSSSDAGSVGLGFAIPVNTVKSDLATLRAGGSDS
ncbi:trypsin-like peptidase domain-containing protein [Streptomyces sp. ID05-04B]|uniref:S1C family serine protease n=1 Tax=unclassified Streptomyces TaxID=2593676 RepID=UPI000D1A1A2E|nr:MULTISPECIES: trypsin-like peptidase domain-containing protein [unclassified Streptomyces]AVV41910.1 serine protease [Streptomyces sp. P3]MDX5566888.1 trypsin-like peptidase domain-containing protein [Streptomyces sp. ID05-04B]